MVGSTSICRVSSPTTDPGSMAPGQRSRRGIQALVIHRAGVKRDLVQGHGRGLIDVVAEFRSRAVIDPGWAGDICFPQHDHLFGTIELQVRILDDFHPIAPSDHLCASSNF